MDGFSKTSGTRDVTTSFLLVRQIALFYYLSSTFLTFSIPMIVATKPCIAISKFCFIFKMRVCWRLANNFWVASISSLTPWLANTSLFLLHVLGIRDILPEKVLLKPTQLTLGPSSYGVLKFCASWHVLFSIVGALAALKSEETRNLTYENSLPNVSVMGLVFKKYIINK